MAYTLRPYQSRVVTAFCEALSRGCNSPVASVVTGGGKSLIIAELARRFTSAGRRVLAVTHVRELIGQLEQTAVEHGLPSIGVYAAGMKRRDTEQSYVIAQIQSMYQKMTEFGKIDALIIDECHLINEKDSGMYREVIRVGRVVNPDMRVLGVSGTPFRMQSGLVYGKGRFFEECVCNVGMAELIKDGYLTPLVGKSGDADPQLGDVEMRGGDFVAGSLERVMADEKRVQAAAIEIKKECETRRKSLVFAAGLKHARMIVDALRGHDLSVDMISGDMSASERDSLISAFKEGRIRFLVNVGVLTTGFDEPAIDAVIILRPTRSPGLLLQMAGRGLRKHAAKQDCLILDFGGCLSHFGPLDQIESRIRRKDDGKGTGAPPQKTCPNCHLVVPAGKLRCDCGYEWPRAVANHDEKASTLSPMSTTPEKRNVRGVSYHVQASKDPAKPPTMCVVYRLGFVEEAREFISVDVASHPYARSKAIMWLRDTPLLPGFDGRTLTLSSGTITGTTPEGQIVVQHAIELTAFSSCFAQPETITVVRSGKYLNVIDRHFHA